MRNRTRSPNKTAGIFIVLFYFSSLFTGIANALDADHEKLAWLDGMYENLLSQKEVKGNLHLMRFTDSIYVLTKEISWSPSEADRSKLPTVENIMVPKGFVTDFASVPRIFWSIIPRDGEYTYPAILHDYLYWDQSISREDADLIFKMAMSEFKVGSVQRNAIYWAVRAAGNFAWDANNSAKSNGEQRILKRLPEDPKMTWSEWKTDKKNF